MANDDDGVPPPATNPPDTRILDGRIDAALARRLGGSDGGGPYEARLAKLESDVSNLDRNLADMRGTLQTIQKDVSSLLQRVTGTERDIAHLPTKGFIIKSVSGALALFGAIVIFQHQIQQIVGLMPIGK